MEAYPLKFQPIFKRRIWGGQRLREVFGKGLPADERIGESWELADLPEDKSVIKNGELSGRTLAEALERYGEVITGDKDYSGPFGLLIKFLDAQEDLSVQVHPDEQTCRRMGKGEPKSECWYIIGAEPGAVIYKGLKEGVTREEFGEAIRTGGTAELLVRVEVEAGECHYLPAGTAHSIGAGLLIAEIQTPSDTTYRVFDWNRIDERSGKGREFHIAEALESINFEQSADELAVASVGRVVGCEHFTVDKGHQAKGCERLLSPGEMKVVIVVSGFGAIIGTRAEEVGFKAGDTLLVPAAYEGAMCFGDDTEYLVVTT